MSESTDNNTRDLATAERAAGSKIYIGGAKFLLPIALVLFIVAQFLRYFGSLTGLDVFMVTDAAKTYMLSAPVYISSWLGLLALLILAPATLISRSTLVSWAGWATVTAAFFTSLLVWWLSLTPPGDLPQGVGIGFVIQEVAYILAILGFALTLFTRTPEQIALAEERRRVETEREASNEQATILAKKRAEDHPLLADDRRARAHNRSQSSYGRDTKK
ncbi:MAG: hypothetical protein SPK00_02955 [Corynebacterium glucuronolyticum]|nr:hypothetical protein [Corynebacterium glucuronolyticum]MDD7586841.1 hypothetical protein [Mycobacteriaceae bacterium]MDY5833698.1 hypothetical protein [Corynebacterium glucuronolyticum]